MQNHSFHMKLCSLVLPIAFQNLMTALVSTSDALMKIFTNDPELIAAGIPYLRIVSWSYLFMGVSQIYLCIMKNSGKPLLSTLYGSTALVLNMLLNALLIFGLSGFPQRCAGGDTCFGLLCDTVTMWLIIVPIGLAAVFLFKLPVLWVYFLLNLDEIIKLPAVYRHYKRYYWVKNLTQKGGNET